MIELHNISRYEKTENTSYEVPYCYSSTWFKLYEDVFRYTPEICQIKHNNIIIGIFYFVIIKSFIFGNRIISMPISDEGGVILYDEQSLSRELKKKL